VSIGGILKIGTELEMCEEYGQDKKEIFKYCFRFCILYMWLKQIKKELFCITFGLVNFLSSAHFNQI
jgi:hypothetical protein